MKLFYGAAVCGLMLALASPAQAICLWNCKPSEADARTSFEREVAMAHRGAAYSVESFKVLKTYEVNGPFGAVYNVQAEAVVLYPNGVKRPLGDYMIQPGDRKTYVKNIEFLKTDKGWLGKDGQLY